VKPASPKLASSRLKVVTIVTSPKSLGVSSRAKITVPDICIMKTDAWAKTVTPALRTVRLASCPSSARSRKFPRSLKGLKLNSIFLCRKPYHLVFLARTDLPTFIGMASVIFRAHVPSRRACAPESAQATFVASSPCLFGSFECRQK